MWDLVQIKKQKKYCLEKLLEKNLSEEEINKIKLTVLSYLYMIDSSGTFYKTTLPKLADIITNGKYIRYKKYKYNKFLSLESSGNVKYEEVIFLIKLLMKLVKGEISYEKEEFDTINISNDELISLAREYYENFFDKEISGLALGVLNSPTNINFTKNTMYQKDNIGGNMYMDYLFNKTYINIYLHQNINDYNSIVHELMHCVDHLFNPKYPDKYHIVVNEIPGYTSDFLFLNYLENIEFNKIELEKLKKQKVYTIYALINNTFNKIKENYYNMYNLEMTEYSPLDMIKNSLTPHIIANLIEIKSIIVSYGLYLQINETPSKGFNNLKKYMKEGKSIESNFEFDFIEISNEKIMEIAEEYMEYSQNIINKTSKLNR